MRPTLKKAKYSDSNKQICAVNLSSDTANYNIISQDNVKFDQPIEFLACSQNT